MSSPFFIVALSATYRRPKEICRLAQSLGRLSQPLGAWIVVDNGGDLPLAEVADLAQTEVIPITPHENLGCGAALAEAELLALQRFESQLTHIWILDDDAVVDPTSLELLLQALERQQAALAYPMVTDDQGKIDWVPGLLDRSRLMALKSPHTPAEYLARYGPDPLPVSWAQGVALLVTRQALEQHGPHRADYWVRGEDLEFALRLTFHGLGLFVPAAEVAHLPPPNFGHSGAPDSEYAKHLAMLQNVAYTGLRLPHGHRIARTIPGNCWRFLRKWGLNPRTLWGVASALFAGALLQQPAGARPPSVT